MDRMLLYMGTAVSGQEAQRAVGGLQCRHPAMDRAGGADLDEAVRGALDVVDEAVFRPGGFLCPDALLVEFDLLLCPLAVQSPLFLGAFAHQPLGLLGIPALALVHPSADPLVVVVAEPVVAGLLGGLPAAELTAQVAEAGCGPSRGAALPRRGDVLATVRVEDHEDGRVHGEPSPAVAVVASTWHRSGLVAERADATYRHGTNSGDSTRKTTLV